MSIHSSSFPNFDGIGKALAGFFPRGWRAVRLLPDKLAEEVKISMPAVFMITRKMPRLHSSSHLLTLLIKPAQWPGCLQFVGLSLL
jgi:hypothetical protein